MNKFKRVIGALSFVTFICLSSDVSFEAKVNDKSIIKKENLEKKVEKNELNLQGPPKKNKIKFVFL